MPKHIVVSGKALIKKLKKLGFEVVRVNGSHHIMEHADGRKTTVPLHSNEIIGIGLFKSILSDVRLEEKDFISN